MGRLEASRRRDARPRIAPARRTAVAEGERARRAASAASRRAAPPERTASACAAALAGVSLEPGCAVRKDEATRGNGGVARLRDDERALVHGLDEARRGAAETVEGARREAEALLAEARRALEAEVARLRAGAAAEVERERARARASTDAASAELALRAAANRPRAVARALAVVLGDAGDAAPP